VLTYICVILIDFQAHHDAFIQKIVNYFCYIDDILVIFNPIHTNIQATLDDFNAIHPKLKFTVEIETNNMLNYLDISMQKPPPTGKPPITESLHSQTPLSPFTSNHPTQQKYAASKFLYNRLNSYDLQEEEYQQEENIIHNIM